MKDWDEIKLWRRTTRARLLQQRAKLPQAERPNLRALIEERLTAEVPELRHAAIGFYWPFKSEVDLRAYLRACLKQGAEAALPVVVAKREALEFWAWRPRSKLARGIWNIPVPAERCPVRPNALLVPLVGFDAAGYRLGYGGGYYDRTLAALSPRPLTIGIGYECGRLETIHPQPHDIPLDMIVTEACCTRHRYRGMDLRPARRAGIDNDGGEPGFASPPCLQHEIDPSYLGYLSETELAALLADLQQEKRSAAETLASALAQAAGGEARARLRDLALDEAHSATVLQRQQLLLTGRTCPAAPANPGQDGPGESDLIASLARRLDLGSQRLDRILPRVREDFLSSALSLVRDLSRVNRARCEEFLYIQGKVPAPASSGIQPARTER